MTNDAWMLTALLVASCVATMAPLLSGLDREGAAHLSACGLLGVVIALGLLSLELWTVSEP